MGYGMKYTKGGFPFKSPIKKLQVEDTEENVIQINDEGEDIEKENIESVSKDKLITSEPDKQQQIIDRRKAMLNKKRELGISTLGFGSHNFESNKEEL